MLLLENVDVVTELTQIIGYLEEFVASIENLFIF
jgi:hypothetical protein